MFFWWYMLVCVLICPLAMMFGGRLMWKHCANGKPGAVGYRSRRSVASREAWRFANEDCGRRWWRWGCALLIPSVVAMLPVYGADDGTVGIMGGIVAMIDCVIILLTILPTETALRRKFDNKAPDVVR